MCWIRCIKLNFWFASALFRPFLMTCFLKWGIPHLIYVLLLSFWPFRDLCYHVFKLILNSAEIISNDLQPKCFGLLPTYQNLKPESSTQNRLVTSFIRLFYRQKQVQKKRPFRHKLAFQKSRGPMIPFSYQVIKFRLGLLFQNDKIIIHN